MEAISKGASASEVSVDFTVYFSLSLAVFTWGVLCNLYHCIGVGEIPMDAWAKAYL